MPYTFSDNRYVNDREASKLVNYKQWEKGEVNSMVYISK